MGSQLNKGIFFVSLDEITMKLRKKEVGEHFEDTNMINKLMVNKKKKEPKKKAVKIEVLDS